MESTQATPRTGDLAMRWLPVTDPHGRTRMEAVWVDESAHTAAATHAA